MASPVGHVMVGLACAAVAARVTGTTHSPQLWIGAFVATGIPDLDYVPALFGVRRPHMHRNASHSLFVMGAIVAGAWLALGLVPYTVSSGTLWVWAVALFSHPLVDVVTTGPVTAARGYGSRCSGRSPGRGCSCPGRSWKLPTLTRAARCATCGLGSVRRLSDWDLQRPGCLPWHW